MTQIPFGKLNGQLAELPRFGRWATLRPKTKADCTVDVMVVDVPNKMVVLDEQGAKS
jgi:hypothetical protein